LLTPLLGEAATTSWPPWRRMATVLEPIRPVPPYPPLSMAGDSRMGSNASEQRRRLVSFVNRRTRVIVPRRHKSRRAGLSRSFRQEAEKEVREFMRERA